MLQRHACIPRKRTHALNAHIPASTIPIDLTTSQDEKNNTQAEEHMQLVDDLNDSFFDQVIGGLTGRGSTTADNPPPSPLKIFNNSNSAVGSAASAAVSLTMLGGLPPTTITTTDPPASDGSTTN